MLNKDENKYNKYVTITCDGTLWLIYLLNWFIEKWFNRPIDQSDFKNKVTKSIYFSLVSLFTCLFLKIYVH